MINKDKANLFLRIKTAKIQEEQLLNLLDSVPDKVLISELRHDGKPTPIYTNRAMRMLFGGDALNQELRKDLMSRRVFTELEPGDRHYRSSQRSSVNLMATENRHDRLSLNMIVMGLAAEDSTLEKAAEGSFKETQTKRYNMLNINRYAANGEPRVVEIAILNVFYDNKLCKLLFMRDISKVLADTEAIRKRR